MRFRNNASAQNDMLLSAVRNAFERMGKTLPKPATEPRDMSEVFAQPGALHEAATAAILAGRDPLADEAVKRAQLGAQLAAVGVYEAV